MKENETKEVAIREEGLLPTTQGQLEQIKADIKLIDSLYKSIMVEGTDYDTIPGTKQPTLMKSGAELLRSYFGFHIEEVIEDISNLSLDIPLIRYRIRTLVYKNSDLICVGVGECSSAEEKYAWQKCSKKEYEELSSENRRIKWYPNKFSKTKDDQYYPEYQARVTNTYDRANTILKMAKKRSFVDAMLTATGASRIFTQDLEETKEETTEQIHNNNHPTDKPPTAPPQQKTSAPPREKLLFDIEGIVAEFKQKDGEKNGKKWTLTTIKMDDGTELKTFDTNFAKILYDAQRRMIPVKITSDTENIIQSVDPVRQPGED